MVREKPSGQPGDAASREPGFALEAGGGYDCGMFPARRQQLFFAFAVAVAGVAMGLLKPGFHPGGLSLLTSAGGPESLAWLVVGVALLLGLGYLGGVLANPLAGPAILATGLTIAAAITGSIGWLIRSTGSPSTYLLLMAEAALWALPYVGLVLALALGRTAARPWLPTWARSSYFAELAETADDQPRPMAQAMAAVGPIIFVLAGVLLTRSSLLMDFAVSVLIALAIGAVAWAGTLAIENRSAPGHRFGWHAPLASAFLAGMVPAGGGAGLMLLLAQSPDEGQIIGALIVSFALAALLGHQLFPSPARLPILLAPLAVAFGAYLWTGLSVGEIETLRARFYMSYPPTAGSYEQTVLLPTAMALPVYYASAGVLGTVLGLGWSQSLHYANQRHVAMAG